MAELLALVSIVSGAAVAIAVPFVSARLEGKRLERAAHDARLQELRVLLDDAVQHLYGAWTILFEVEQEAQRGSRRTEGPEDRLRGLAQSLTASTDSVVQDGLRIKLRTPPGDGTGVAHEAAVDHVLRYEAELRHFLESESVARERPPPPPTNDLSAAIGRFMDEVRGFAGIVEPAAPVPLPSR